MTRHPHELADGLMRQVPRLVRKVEGQHGFKLADCFARRGVPEFRRVIAALVRGLDECGWSVEQIAESIDTTREAVERALRPTTEEPS